MNKTSFNNPTHNSAESSEDLNNQLFESVRRNDIENVLKLLNESVKIDSTNQNGETPLVLAVQLGFFKMVKLLLERGANTEVEFKDEKSGKGIKPVDIARRLGNKDIARLLGQWGNNPLNNHSTVVEASNEAGSTYVPVSRYSVGSTFHVTTTALNNALPEAGGIASSTYTMQNNTSWRSVAGGGVSSFLTEVPFHSQQEAGGGVRIN